MSADLGWALFALALGWAALLPWPVVQGPSSWVAWVALALSGLYASGQQLRGRSLLLLGALSAFGLTLLAHGYEAFAALPWALGALLVYLGGRQQLATPERRSALVHLFAAVTAWHFFLGWGQGTGAGVGLVADILARGRLQGAMATPNVLAAFILLWLPLSLELALFSRGPRWGLWLSVPLGALALLSTASTGAALALCLAAVFFVLPHKRLTLAWKLVFTALSLGLLAYLAYSRAQTFTFAGDGHDAFSGRWRHWKPALMALAEAPLFGLGPARAQSALAALSAHGEDPHSWPLWLALRFGVLGLLAGLGLLALLWAKVRVRLRLASLGDGSLGLALGLTAALIQGLGELSYSQPLVPLLSFAWAGALSSSRWQSSPVALPGRFAWQGALVLFGICLFWAGILPWQMPLLLTLLTLFLLHARAQVPAFNAQTGVERGLSAASVLLLALTAFSTTPGTSLGLSIALTGIALAWMALRRNAWPWQTSLRTLLLSLGLLAALGLLAGMAIHNEGPLDSVRSVFPNQNLFASLLLAPAYLACVGLRRGPGSKVLAYGGKVALGAALVACGSRGALVALGVALVWIFLRSSRGEAARRDSWLAAIALLALSLWLPYSRFKPAALAAPAADAYRYERLEFWRQGALLALERPLTGWGLGAFQSAMHSRDLPTKAGEEALGRYRLRLEHAHQEFIEMGAEMGLAALALALVAIGALLRRCWSQRSRSEDEVYYESVLLLLLAHAMVDFPFRTPLAWALGGMILALRFPQRRGASGLGAEPLPALPLMLAASLAVSFTLGVWVDRQARAVPTQRAVRMDAAAQLLAPLDARAWDSRARRTVQAGRDPRWLLRKALAQSATLEQDPEMDLALYRLCLASAPYYGTVKSDPIELLLRSGSSLRDSLPQASTALVLALQAREHLQRVVAAWPTFAAAWLELAQLEHSMGQVAHARASLQRCLDLEPAFARALELRLKTLDSKAPGARALESSTLDVLDRLQPLRVRAIEPYSKALLEADWVWIEARLKKRLSAREN